jgi:hypothetical protein
VHGVVLNSATGQPIPHALVTVQAVTKLGALTDAQGRFEISGVPSDLLPFSVRKPGYRMAAYEEPREESEVMVRVAASMPDIVLRLHPLSLLTGQIQLSTGDPASAFYLDLLRRSVRHGRIVWEAMRGGRTDNQGHFHFPDIEPGIYTLHTVPHLENNPIGMVDPASARGVHRNGYPAVYYPDARTIAGAGQIQVGPGDNAQADLTLTLEPFYPVTVDVTTPSGQRFVPSAAASPSRRKTPMGADLLDPEYRYVGYFAHYDQDTGTIQADLPDGMYVLRAVVNEQSAGPALMGDSKAGYAFGFVPLNVAGHPLPNLQMPLFTPGSHVLRVHRPPDTKPPAAASDFNGVDRLWLSAADPLLSDKDPIDGRRQGDSFELMYHALQPRWLHAQVGYQFCLGAVTGSVVDPAREPITSNPAGPNPPLDLYLRNDCAQLRLALPSSVNADAPGVIPTYTVYVVPDFETIQDAVQTTVSPLQEDRAVLSRLTPGSYHVYSFAEPVELPYRDPGAMAQMQTSGQAITLAPGENAELVLELPSQP